ncbi:MAG: hypothetical protein ACYDED_14795 [Ferrimicrobium sp.]
MEKVARALKETELGRSYERAWREWAQIGNEVAWTSAANDGLI